MTMTDPVADLLTRVRNANRRHAKSVCMPASKLKVRIAQVLQEEGYIRSYRVEPKTPQSDLVLDLKYGPDGELCSTTCASRAPARTPVPRAINKRARSRTAARAPSAPPASCTRAAR